MNTHVHSEARVCKAADSEKSLLIQPGVRIAGTTTVDTTP
jgi:hypothetical protein